MWKKKFCIKDRRSIRFEGLSIGLIALDSSVGLTHTAILLANYLCSCHKKSTALYEIGERDSFNELARIYAKPLGRFSLYDVDYYSKLERSLYLSLRDNYDYNILDFGANLSEYREEFLRCDMRFLFVSLSPWKIRSFLDLLFLEDVDFRQSCRLLYVFGDEITERKLEQEYGVELIRLPYNENPYKLEACTYEAFSKMKLIGI